MKNPIRQEKLKLIALIIDQCLEENSNRKLKWYGDTFDLLYDKDNWDLTKLHNIKMTKRKKEQCHNE